jgi:hypothetical protein
MKLLGAVAFVAVSCASAAAVAQDSLVGTYNGNYEVSTPGGHQRWGVTLTISNVEEGKVKGIATLQRGPCRGDYPVEGVVKNGVIGVSATAKGGPSGDCSFAFKGKVDGTRLVGNMGKYEVELRR